MRFTQKIDRQSLHEAMRTANATENIYHRVAERMRFETNRIYSKGDERDLCELTLFLRYKPVFDDPKNGKPLSDAEFETVCEDVILAFVNDDREKIFGYLDQWIEFAANYNPPTEINNEADALKHFVYLRSQQGLGVTKLKEYPEYIATHFPDITSRMKLQKVEQQLMIQSMWNGFLFMDNDVKIDSSTLIALDKDPAKQLAENQVAREVFEAVRPAVSQRLPFADALMEAFELDKQNPAGEASIKKFEITDWAKSLKGKNFDTDASPDELENITSALRAALGSESTGYGLMKKYSDSGKLDLDLYKTVFIDGISIYDMLPDPKNPNAGAAKFMDAIVNQTGVVSIVQVAEINGKFEYKSDIIDVSTGEDDSEEYAVKIDALKKNEQYRKALFNAQKASLDQLLIPGRENYSKKLAEKTKQDAQRAEKRAPYANGKNDFSIKADEPTIAEAYRLIEEGRKPYSLVAENLLKATYVDRQGNEQPNPIAQALSQVDDRDFLDIILFTRFAKTLGVGDVDLTEEETLKESVKMLKAFAEQKHDEMKVYLDRMYDFLESYTPPAEIKTVEDVFKTVLYMRVQQTSEVKLLENRWYYEERYTTQMDKADFSAFEAQYLVAHAELLNAWERDTWLNLGAGFDYKVLVERANAKKEMKESAPDEYNEMRTTELRTGQFHQFTYDYVAERRRRLAYADDFGGKSNFYKLRLPQSALALSGENPDKDAFDDCSIALWVGCVDNIYNSTFIDSAALRSYGFTNSAASDAVHLIFVDGKSIYDLAKEANNGVYSERIARNTLLSALVNQSGLVQFARIMKDGEELKVEVDTVDFLQKGVTVKPEYEQKMAQYVADIDTRYNQIKTSVINACNAKKAEVEANERNKQYVAAEEEQWKGFDPEADDLFAPSEYDKQVAAQERIEAYMREQEDQLNNLFNAADLDLFKPTEYDEQVAAQAEQEKNQLGAVEELNFATYQKGRYFVAKGNPNSAYSVATMGELRELGVFFGAVTTQDDKTEMIAIDNDAGYVSLDSEEQPYDYSNDLAGLCGIKINRNSLESVIGSFILQNADENHTSVDKTIFEKQYKLLFGDLYATALQNLNKQCCKMGATISAEQMDQTLKLLNQVMQDAANNVGYPQKIVNGGYTDEQVKALQENFANQYVPQNSVEQALRKSQASVQGYDFANGEWRESMGYTAFRSLIDNEQTKLDGNIVNTPENKLKVAQTYRAMLEHSSNRSFWSKLFNVFRYFGEQNAIEAYKNQAMTKFAIGERDFNELCASRPNNDVQTLKNGIEKNYRNAVEKHARDNAVSEFSSVHIGGMSERESEQDMENSSVLSSEDNVNRIRISVEEADHKRKADEEKKKEDVKEVRRVAENNIQNQRK